MGKKNFFVIIIFVLGAVQAGFSQIDVSGIVTDKDGEPLPGVNIVVKGTEGGAQTDFDGNYTIKEIDPDATLKFSFVGFKDQTIEVKGNKNIDVEMKEGQTLGEVEVQVGFGTSKKEDLSTAVSTVELDKSFKSGQNDLNSAIQGKIPGLTFQSGGGDPLKEGRISIRGRGSRGSTDDPNSGDGVLTVVDGIPNAPYSMSNVESVSVLKDAASSAIYGANVGSGGVIEITTKQPEKGEPEISFNTYQGFKRVSNLPGTTTAEEYNNVWAKAIEDRASGETSSLPEVADPDKYPYGTKTRTDWFDEVFRTAYQQHYDVSITGGGENLKALTSFSYDKNEGTMRNTYGEKLNAKLKVDFKLTDWLKISQIADYEHSKSQGDLENDTHEGVLASTVFYPRSATIYEHNEEGDILFDQYGHKRFGGTIPEYLSDKVSGFGEIRNPVAMLERVHQYRPVSRINSTSLLEVNPIEGLTVRSRYTAGLKHHREESFDPRVPEIGRPEDENERSVSSSQRTNWEWETTANYDRDFGDHNIDALVGFNVNRENYRRTATSVFDFDKEDRHSTIFPNGDDYSKEKPEEEIWDEKQTSFFSRIGYSYADRYFVTASVRRDATSKLFKENNSQWFPAVSASWKLSSESFFDHIIENSPINLIKLRGGWGQVGNVSLVPRYAYDAPLAFPDWPYVLGKDMDNEVFGSFQETLSNRGLTWETTEQTGAGLDLTFFDRTLDFSVDYYHKTTKDLIEREPSPSVAGVAEDPYGNVGKVVNKGWEFQVNYDKSFGDFDIGIYGNINTVKNTVEDLGERDHMSHDVVLNGQRPLRSTQGESWYSFYVLETDGIFQSKDEINNYVNSEGDKVQPDAVPGDLKYIDQNNDGKINDDDKAYKGDYLPELTYAFGANISYKNFDLSIDFQGVDNVTIYNGFKQMGLSGRDSGNNMLSDVLDSWNFDKDSGIPRLAMAGDANGNYTEASDFLLESGSYLRLKKLTFGYTLPDSVLESIGMKEANLRIYFNAENLFTITPYSGIDPEVGNFGMDGGTYPVARTFSLGLNLNI